MFAERNDEVVTLSDWIVGVEQIEMETASQIPHTNQKSSKPNWSETKPQPIFSHIPFFNHTQSTPCRFNLNKKFQNYFTPTIIIITNYSSTTPKDNPSHQPHPIHPQPNPHQPQCYPWRGSIPHRIGPNSFPNQSSQQPLSHSHPPLHPSSFRIQFPFHVNG